MSEQTMRPKVGLALSGASTRAVFYIGFLEVLAQHNIPIDYIAASSSGTIVAMAYAAGTLPQLKDQVLRLDKTEMLSYMGKINYRSTGLYSMDAVEELFRHYSRGLKFEEARPLMGFVAVDINRGEQVVLSIGDMAHAARVSCTLPLIFEPAEWGGNQLVDGGLLNIVPIDVVKEAGMDITLSLNIRGTRHIFKSGQLQVRRAYNTVKRLFFINRAQGLLRWATNSLSSLGDSEYVSVDVDMEQRRYNSIFSVLGRCLDLASEAAKKTYEYVLHTKTDFLITPTIPKTSLSGLQLSTYYYEAGRREAEAIVPKLLHAIENYENESRSGRYEVVKL